VSESYSSFRKFPYHFTQLKAYFDADRDIARVGLIVLQPQAAEPKQQQNEYFKLKKNLYSVLNMLKY
jgi:hypothetical protein